MVVVDLVAQVAGEVVQLAFRGQADIRTAVVRAVRHATGGGGADHANGGAVVGRSQRVAVGGAATTEVGARFAGGVDIVRYSTRNEGALDIALAGGGAVVVRQAGGGLGVVAVAAEQCLFSFNRCRGYNAQLCLLYTSPSPRD